MNRELTIRPEDEGNRLDRVLASAFPELSRSRIQQLITGGLVRVEGAPVRASYRASPGARVTLCLPPPEPVGIDPEEVSLDIFFEDVHLLVVHKPAGMSVHPAGGARTGTLVNALLGYCKQLSGINGELRPGIVHRLDKETSGLLMVAKDDAAHRGLAAQLEARSVDRQYLALVWGHPRGASGRVEGNIGRHPADRKRMAVLEDGGRHAGTRYETAAEYAFLTLLRVKLETGRTHQIRVHMAHIGHPVFGDGVYGGRQRRVKGIAPQFRGEAQALLSLAPRQMLHAQVLGFVHPVTGEKLRFEADPPTDMRAVLERLNAGGGQR